jgi:pyrroline-5-carboxylate reductase
MAIRLGFLGAGQMASALARGLVAGGRLSGHELGASDPSEMARQTFQRMAPHGTCLDDNRQLVEASETVVLAVKPQHVESVAEQVRGALGERLLISIVAGATIEQLTDRFGTRRILRVMPNAPCLVGHGAAGMASGPEATQADIVFVREMMSAVGHVHLVAENLLDAVTGLSGSGPAFVALFIEALSDGGVRMGLPRDVALQLAAQTVAGTARMILDDQRHPAQLKDQVASPGGTTIAGIQVLEERGLRGAAMAAVVAATERAQQLGQ